jgi:hypothetical protein
MSIKKNSNDTIWNRTRDFPACSAVPQPTAPPRAAISYVTKCINLLKPTGHVMHQQFNIQQLYALPTLYLCVLYLSENKQRLVPRIIFYNRDEKCLLRGKDWSLNKAVCASSLKG